MPRKGTRRIVVDGTVYRWRVTRSGSAPSVGDPLVVVVAGADGEHASRRPLRVTLGDVRPVGYCCPPCMVLAADAEPATPERVADAIRRARTLGWEPDGTGGPFDLDHRVTGRSDA